MGNSKMKKALRWLIVIPSLAGTLLSLVAGVIIIRNYLEERDKARLIAKDPQSVQAQVVKIKDSLAKIDALASEVETLGAAAIEAQRQANQAHVLVNMSEGQIAALEQRLNPAAGIWLNIGIGVVMLFVGYFLERVLDRLFKDREPDKTSNRAALTELPVIPSLPDTEKAVVESAATAELAETATTSAHNPAVPADDYVAAERH